MYFVLIAQIWEICIKKYTGLQKNTFLSDTETDNEWFITLEKVLRPRQKYLFQKDEFLTFIFIKNYGDINNQISKISAKYQNYSIFKIFGNFSANILQGP